jgi:hypothetical protein
MRERRKQRALCGEAEAGRVLYGQGGGGEVAGGGGVLILIGFEGVGGEEETGRHYFSGGVKAALQRFSSALRARRRVAVGRARHGGNIAKQRREMITLVGRLGLERPC